MVLIKAVRQIMVSGIMVGIAACAATEGDRAAVQQADPAIESEDYATARNHLETGQYGLAVAKIETFLIAEPKSEKGRVLAGVIYDQIARYDLADSHYRAAIELDPSNLATKNNYALSKLQWAKASGRIELAREALTLLEEADGIEEQNAKVERNKAQALALITELEARQAAEAAQHLQPLEPVSIAFSPSAWLELRAANYTFVVTEVSASMVDAITRLHLDPAVAMVTPGARYADSNLPAAREPLPKVTRVGRQSAKTPWYRNLSRAMFANATGKGRRTAITKVIREALAQPTSKARRAKTAWSPPVSRLLVLAKVW